MEQARTEEADVVVVGGGPAGSTLAALVALRGHRVVLLEKERFPRYQIGESLLPATVHGVCRLTGVADELAAAGFTKKRGGTFRWGTNPDPWTFSFSVSPRMAGPSSFAYQVERSKFDQILLDHARRLGVDVREGSTVHQVLDDGARVRGVGYTDEDGTRHEILSRYVADASGNRSQIHDSASGTRKYSDFFRNLALFGYFTGGKRLPEPDSGNILSAAFGSGWFWYIPLSPELTSVGAVVRRDMAQKVQGDPEKALFALIDECPLIKEYLADAERVTTGQYGQLRVRKDYSYQATAYWRPGMVLVGDAACFVDPVFSSGVHLATYSALLAARSVNSVLAGALDEDTAFREFEARYRREYSVFYEFLVSFYDMNATEGSYFWQAKKVTGSAAAEFESFIELVGGVASGETALTSRRSAVADLRSRSAEFSQAVDQVGAGGDATMLPLFRSEVVRNAMREGGQVQSRAMLGEDSEDETPLFPGGLVSSPDGLLWHYPQGGRTAR
ncbi:tryptophan 7-halogenase [Streptomyces shenzhenensis]|uniref:tryptophan 7-halogenase n=1 Tax=Streptomyces shenzhenensis TaxID=943815 RepID=UPI0015F10414|nr:tryptophan 7-halogenase [Streptomyces shenzhenensis]